MQLVQVALDLAESSSAAYARLADVQAVALGGSYSSGFAGAGSDIDLYVYAEPLPAVEERRRIAAASAVRCEVDNRFWEPGDEWIDRATGIKVDVMFRTPAWMEEQIERLLVRHEASVGYSTCFWHNLLASTALFDRAGWYAALQERAAAPYPEGLRRAVVDKNFPILDRALSAYTHQIEHAAQRGDLVSVNHRAAAFLASYFDILFALNRLPHPGEKRLLAHAARCPLQPEGMAAQVTALLRVAGEAPMEVLARARELTAGMERLLVGEGLLEG